MHLIFIVYCELNLNLGKIIPWVVILQQMLLRVFNFNTSSTTEEAVVIMYSFLTVSIEHRELTLLREVSHLLATGLSSQSSHPEPILSAPVNEGNRDRVV